MILLICMILVVAWFLGWALLNISGALSLALLVASLGAIALESARRRTKAKGSEPFTTNAKYRIVGLGMVLHDDGNRKRIR